MIAAYLAGATFLLAHSINAFVEDRLMVLPSIGPEAPPSPDIASSAVETSVQQAERIQSSGLFLLPLQPSAPSADGAPAKPVKPPLNLGQKIRLLGTVTDDLGGGFAMTEELPSKRQSLVRLHDMIEHVGEVRLIRRDGIVIGQDDQEEVVELAILQGDQNQPQPVPPQPVPVAPPKRTLDRREMAEAVKDPSKLFLQVHAVPYFYNAVLQGFRLDFVNPGGFFDKAGFLYGDVIQRINGVEIRDPGRLLGMFTQVVDERTVKVDILRAAQNTTLTYELR
jgi:general secretion pathway protein C